MLTLGWRWASHRTCELDIRLDVRELAALGLAVVDVRSLGLAADPRLK